MTPAGPFANPPRYTAIVLAGDRGPNDPVAQAAGAPCKALTLVQGKALVWRVIDTLKQIERIESIVVVGPTRAVLDTTPGLAQALDNAGVSWIAPAASPSRSAALALDTLPADTPVLLTTADHALLQADMVTQLLHEGGKHDLAVAMTTYDTVKQAYPKSRRTALRLGPGAGYCGCNLFAINNANGRRLVTQWRSVEAQRKHPVRVIIGMLGWVTVLRYVCRRLTLEQAFTRLSQRLGIRVGTVLLSDPHAAIDVDSPADLALVEQILVQQAASGE